MPRSSPFLAAYLSSCSRKAEKRAPSPLSLPSKASLSQPHLPPPPYTHTRTRVHPCTSLALGASCTDRAALTFQGFSDQPPLHSSDSPPQVRLTLALDPTPPVLQIALSSHSLLPPGYKADQILPVPTTATTVTKTKNPSGMLISPQALSFSLFLLKSVQNCFHFINLLAIQLQKGLFPSGF